MNTLSYLRFCIVRSQRGIILPLVLVFLALGMLLLTPALGHGYSALAGTSIVESKAEEVHAADSGIEEGLYWLIHGTETRQRLRA